MGMLAVLRDELGYAPGRLVVGHVQHGIRPTENLDLNVIHAEAMDRSLSVSVRSVNAPELAKREKLSLEAAARRLRYQALSQMADEANCQWILTAHTLDDSAETIWMRMKSGAPWYEWTGIPAQRDRILRPLLGVMHSDLRTWTIDHGVSFLDDETNLDTQFQRNVIRMEMTRNSEVWSRSRKQELALAGEALNLVLRFQKKLACCLPLTSEAGQEGGSVGLAIDRIFIYFKSLTFLPVEAKWAELSGNPEARLPSASRRQIADLLIGMSPEARLTLPGEISLIRRGNTLWIARDTPFALNREVSLGRWAVPALNRVLALGIGQNGSGARLSSQFTTKPLHLRTWQPGDRIKIQRRPEKNISDLLNEQRLDPMSRKHTLVLADELGPLMILGGVIAERALPGDNDDEFLFVTWTSNDGQSDET